jgi:type II protein arginine methyltransferase
VINKRSTDLVVGVDLPERANFLVTETFDVGLIGEGVVTSAGHALDQLLVPDAIVMPARARVYATLVECPALAEFGRVEEAVGIDLRPFNVFATGIVNQRLASYPHRTLCKRFDVFGFDFRRPIERAARELSVQVDADGLCNAIVFWYELELDPHTRLSTDPQTPSHWHQAIQLLDEPVELAAGTTCRVAASHNCASITLGLL